MTNYELISFVTCPFVQRSVITLLEKGVNFNITYIDLENKPEWFLKISPFGKVPVLKVADHILFESAVINEYLDEINPPSMHPQDPLLKAQNKAWIEFESTLNMDLYQLALTKTKNEYEEKEQIIKNKLKQVEEQIKNSPFFNGNKMGLIDAAYAPFFQRVSFLQNKGILKEIYENLPKNKTWAENLLKRESVKKSVREDIEEQFINFIQKKKGYLSELIK